MAEQTLRHELARKDGGEIGSPALEAERVDIAWAFTVDQLEARGLCAVLTDVGASVGVGEQHERECRAAPLELALVEGVQRTEQAAPVQECGEVVELGEQPRPAILVEGR